MTETPGEPPATPDDTEENRKPGGQFKPGRSGNPRGRPKGARSRLTVVSEHLEEGDLGKIIEGISKKAKMGSLVAAKMLLDYCAEPRPRDPVAPFKMPPLRTAADAKKAISSIVRAAAAGELTPSEARDMAALVEAFARAHEIGELEERLAAIDQEHGKQ